MTDKADEVARKMTRNLALQEAIAAALRSYRNEAMEALTESVKLQSHYAALLNDYDGGKRMQFSGADAWIERLRSLKSKEPQG